MNEQYEEQNRLESWCKNKQSLEFKLGSGQFSSGDREGVDKPSALKKVLTRNDSWERYLLGNMNDESQHERSASPNSDKIIKKVSMVTDKEGKVSMESEKGTHSKIKGKPIEEIKES